jgi:hypothetical protein
MVPLGPIQWLFLGVEARSFRSSTNSTRLAGNVTLYTIWPVGIGGRLQPRAICRHTECTPDRGIVSGRTVVA